MSNENYCEKRNGQVHLRNKHIEIYLSVISLSNLVALISRMLKVYFIKVSVLSYSTTLHHFILQICIFDALKRHRSFQYYCYSSFSYCCSQALNVFSFTGLRFAMFIAVTFCLCIYRCLYVPVSAYLSIR